MRDEGDEEPSRAPATPEDYTTLYRVHHGRVARLCRLLLADRHEADDVTQEVFVKLLQAHQRNPQQMAWGPWLTRVAINACHDRRRSGWWKWWRLGNAEFVEADMASADFGPERLAVNNELRRAIWDSFRKLSSRQQEVFILRQLEGWSTEEVADLLGVSPGSIKRHLYRAVHHLRRALRGQV